MKQFSRYIFISVVTLFFVEYADCQNSTQALIKKINGNPITFRNDISVSVKDILIISDDLLIIGDDGDNLFHFYSLTDWSKKYSYAKRGEGPGEFRSTPQVTKIGNMEGYLSVYDYSKLSTSILKINNLSSNYKISIVNSNMFDSEIGIPQERQFVTANVLVGHGGLYDSKMVVQEMDTNVYIDYLPEIEGYESHQFLSLIYSGHLVVKPNGEQFVFAMNYFDRIEIYSSKGKLLKVCSHYLNNDDQLYELTDDGKRKNYYKDVKVTEKFIYGLYNGRSNNVVEQIFPKLTGGLFEIHIFNWDGEIVKVLKLDHNISLIAVDKKDGFFIGFDPTSEEFPLLYFVME